MVLMEISTFGALLAFAIDLEERTAAFYESAANMDGCTGVRDTLLEMAGQNRKRKGLLVSTRQENITEMVLEPISDLHARDYMVETELSQSLDCPQVLAKASELEQRAQRFYTDAGEKAKHLLAGVARTFARLAREKGSRIHELKALTP
jgi:rubrerythrin